MDYINSLHIKNFLKMLKSQINLVKLIKSLKKKNKKIIGYGASAKAVTILNYCNLKEIILIIFMIQQTKIGKFLPGTKIKLLNIKNLKIVIFMFLDIKFYKEFLKSFFIIIR